MIKCSTAAVVSSPYCSSPFVEAKVVLELEGSFSLASNNELSMWRGRLCCWTASAKHNATGCLGVLPCAAGDVSSNMACIAYQHESNTPFLPFYPASRALVLVLVLMHTAVLLVLHHLHLHLHLHRMWVDERV